MVVWSAGFLLWLWRAVFGLGGGFGGEVVFSCRLCRGVCVCVCVCRGMCVCVCPCFYIVKHFVLHYLYEKCYIKFERSEGQVRLM